MKREKANVVNYNCFNMMLNWLKNCRGKKAMVYVFCWMMLPLILGFIAMFLLFLALGVFIVMTIGLFIMLLYN